MNQQDRLLGVLRKHGYDVESDRLVINPVPAYAMSMHQALDSDCFVASDGAQRCFVKMYHHEIAGEPAFETVAQAHRAAAAAGLAPQLIASFPEDEANIFAYADGAWRAAISVDLERAALRRSTVMALKSLHALPKLASDRPVHALFDAVLAKIERLRSADGSGAARLVLPEDGAWLIGCLKRLLSPRADAPCVPLHGEILACNLLIGAEGAVQLLDFDRAANGDPLWDLAALALACHSQGPEQIEILTDYGISEPEQQLAPLQRLMAAQDIGWGLWARLAHFVSPRHHIEFFKYGETRLVRARAQLAALGMNEVLA